MSRTLLREALAVVAIGLLAADAGIARGGRGGGQISRGSAQTSVNRSAGASRQVNQNVDRNVNSNVNRNINSNVNRNINSNVNRNINSNVNRNVNVNRDIDFDRDIDVDVDHHYGGGYGCCYHPVATAAAVTAAAVTTAAVVGSVVHTVPSSCEAVSINEFTYQRCGSTWYQPQFSGSTVNYIVVNPPQ